MLVDGGLIGLIALCHAREQAALGHAQPPLVLACPVTLLDLPDAEHAARSAAITQQAKFVGLQLLECALPAAQPHATLKQRRAGALLSAANLALHHGASRVLWCTHAAEGESVDLDYLAWCVDLGLATTRLATLTADNARGITIESPYLDISDAQAADLAVELAAPISTCWWWRGPHTSDDAATKALAAREQSRWVRALASVGWYPSLEAPATSRATL